MLALVLVQALILLLALVSVLALAPALERIVVKRFRWFPQLDPPWTLALGLAPTKRRVSLLMIRPLRHSPYVCTVP